MSGLIIIRRWHFWLKIVPGSEWARVPFALAGIATVGAMMGLMRDQASRRAIGIAQPARLRPLTYAILYLLGGVIAVYCHFLGLVGMAAISFSVLAVSLLRGPVWPNFRSWLLINSVMFVLALPWLAQILAYMGFGGINARVTVFEAA